MTIPSHVILGTVIGTATGNIPLAVAVSVAVDVDHFVSYFKSGVIYKPKKFWQTITAKKDKTGDQRGYLHNVFVATFISALVWLWWPAVALTFGLAYFGHLALDALDASRYWPFYPSKKLCLVGVIPFYSRYELLFSGMMLLVLGALYI